MMSSNAQNKLCIKPAESSKIDSLGHEFIHVTKGDETLKISLSCTIRVPDTGIGDGQTLPNCGPSPILAIENFDNKLPEDMVAKSDLFVPMYGMFSYSHINQSFLPVSLSVILTSCRA